jgi:hypothetical protein
MSEMLAAAARTLARSEAHNIAVDWLRTVPGLPPILQSIHLLAIAVVMGSSVLVALKALGFAMPRQQLSEALRRLMPWTFCALPVLALTGLPFVLARPSRYFANPIFGIKLALLVVALIASIMLYRFGTRVTEPRVGVGIKLAASFSLVAWLGVVLAGRWIAYVDYLFPPE